MRYLDTQNIRRTRACLLATIVASSLFICNAKAAEPPHEKIDQAKESLKEAYRDLDKASDDFGGHKKVAMEKISDAVHTLDKWKDNVSDSAAKVDTALEQLHFCKDKSRSPHPKIDQAITAVEAARMQLRTMQPHPKIDAARSTLAEAYRDLDKASDDFGGHKKEAMEKISDAKHTLDSWDGNVEVASQKVSIALGQLQICKDQTRERHPKIDEAIAALDAVKDELR